MLQAAGADAIGALLVFLNLLECQAKGVGNIGLAHIEHEPAHAQAAADVLVYRIENASGHRPPLKFPRFLFYPSDGTQCGERSRRPGAGVVVVRARGQQWVG